MIKRFLFDNLIFGIVKIKLIIEVNVICETLFEVDVLLFISIFLSDIFRLFESNINQEEFYLVATCSWRPGDLYYKISSFLKQPEHLFLL